MHIHNSQVGVLMGGWSSERDISIESGTAVLDSLQRLGVKAFAFDVTLESVKHLHEQTMDCAFNILHGRGGEDGVIQALLSTLGIAFTGSGITASAISMNKAMTKRVWAGHQIPSPRFIVLRQQSETSKVAKAIGFPCAIKPINEGSSIGVSKVERADQLDDAWQQASLTGGHVLAEQWIDGKEYAVGFVGDQVLPPIQLKPQRAFYDYTAKYEDQGTTYHCPCDLPQQDIQALQAMCLKACDILDIEGWGRVDVIRDAQGNFHLLEVNTVPGMTSHSLVPMSAKVQGIEFDELVMRILNSARRHSQ